MKIGPDASSRTLPDRRRSKRSASMPDIRGLVRIGVLSPKDVGSQLLAQSRLPHVIVMRRLGRPKSTAKLKQTESRAVVITCPGAWGICDGTFVGKYVSERSGGRGTPGPDPCDLDAGPACARFEKRRIQAS